MKTAVLSNQTAALHRLKFCLQVWCWFRLQLPRTQRCWKIRRVKLVSLLPLLWRMKTAVPSNQTATLRFLKFCHQLWSWLDLRPPRTQPHWKFRILQLVSLQPLLWRMKTAVPSNQTAVLHLLKSSHQVWFWFSLWPPRTQPHWKIRRAQLVSLLLFFWDKDSCTIQPDDITPSPEILPSGLILARPATAENTTLLEHHECAVG